MKRPLRLALGLAACLLLNSCVTTSVNPLSSPETAQPDLELVGTWHEKGKTDEFITFSIKDAHWMHLEDRQGGKRTSSCDFFVTIIGDERFMNLRDLDANKPGYTIARYRTISGRGVLTTWSVDRDKAAQAVRSGALKGKLVMNDSKVGNPPRKDFDVKLSDPSEALANFIREKGVNALFNDDGSDLYRIR